jgi:hypothetical protein
VISKPRFLLAAVLAALLLVPAAEAWTWPASGPVLQSFFFDPSHPYDGGQRRGVAIGGDPGSAVAAPVSGTVTFAGSVPSSGRSVTIATADGLSVTLTHLGSLSVKKDVAVVEGESIGTLAATGDDAIPQPYVHLGVRIASQEQGYLDPLSFLPARPSAPVAVAPPAPVEAAPVPAEPPAAAPASPAVVPASVQPPHPVTAPAAEPAAPPESVAAAPARGQANRSVGDGLTVTGPKALRDGHEQSPAAPRTSTGAQDERVDAPARAAAPSAAPAPPRADLDAVASIHAPRMARTQARSVEIDAAPPVDPRAADARRPTARPDVPRQAGDVHVASPREVTTHVARGTAASHRATGSIAAAIALLAATALGVALRAVRMMVRYGGAEQGNEDPRRAGVAVCSRAPAPGTRRGLRRPVGRVRALPPAERERRAHGERHGRARHARDGGRRPGREVLR